MNRISLSFPKISFILLSSAGLLSPKMSLSASFDNDRTLHGSNSTGQVSDAWNRLDAFDSHIANREPLSGPFYTLSDSNNCNNVNCRKVMKMFQVAQVTDMSLPIGPG